MFHLELFFHDSYTGLLSIYVGWIILCTPYIPMNIISVSVTARPGDSSSRVDITPETLSKLQKSPIHSQSAVLSSEELGIVHPFSEMEMIYHVRVSTGPI